MVHKSKHYLDYQDMQTLNPFLFIQIITREMRNYYIYKYIYYGEMQHVHLLAITVHSNKQTPPQHMNLYYDNQSLITLNLSNKVALVCDFGSTIIIGDCLWESVKFFPKQNIKLVLDHEFNNKSICQYFSVWKCKNCGIFQFLSLSRDIIIDYWFACGFLASGLWKEKILKVWWIQRSNLQLLKDISLWICNLERKHELKIVIMTAVSAWNCMQFLN